MTYDGRAVANLILTTAESSGIQMSNLTLQKVMFFCHAWHLVETGNPLIKHEFEAWEHGPVLQYIYRQFKDLGSGEITTKAKSLNPINGKMEVATAHFDEDTADRIKRIVSFYGRMEPWDLVDLSHAKGGPWEKVWNHSGRINPGMKISHDAIRDFYSTALAGSTIQ